MYVYRSTSTIPENIQKAKPKSRESSKAKSRDSSEEKMLSAKKPKTAEKSRQMTIGFTISRWRPIQFDKFFLPMSKHVIEVMTAAIKADK